MESGIRCGTSSSPPSRTSSSASLRPSPPESEAEAAAAEDLLARLELEVAEALAGLAQWGGRGCERLGREWGSKGKRASQRVKTRSPASDSAASNVPNCSVPRSTDLPEDLAVVNALHFKGVRKNLMMKPGEAGHGKLLEPTSASIPYNAPCGAGRSRQNLTEAEKEARRVRRVLANRESARQTIRRRQVLCEELTRKAADLAWENENLKREKELALRDYHSLKTANDCLKAQVAKTTKAEVECVPVAFKGSKAVNCEVEEAPFVSTCSSSATGQPIFLYNQPAYSHFLWHSVVQSPNSIPSDHGPQYVTAVSSEVPIAALGKLRLSPELLNPLSINSSRIPLYILPPPWSFHLPEIKNELQTQSLFSSNDTEDETSLNNHCSAATSSKCIAHLEDPHLLPVNTITEVSSSPETKTTNNLLEVQFSLPLNGNSNHSTLQPRKIVFMPAPFTSSGTSATADLGKVFQTDCVLNSEAILSTECHAASAFADKNSISSSKKRLGSIAAAEARKRRKELTRLKNHNARPWRMHKHVC